MRRWTVQQRVGAVAATLVIVAAILPWATAQDGALSKSMTGIDAGVTHGGLTILVGVIALVAFRANSWNLYNVAIGAGLVGVARSLKDVYDFHQAIAMLHWLGTDMRIAYGMWITLFGCVLCVVMAAKARNVLAEGGESRVPLRDAVRDLRIRTSRGDDAYEQRIARRG